MNDKTEDDNLDYNKIPLLSDDDSDEEEEEEEETKEREIGKRMESNVKSVSQKFTDLQKRRELIRKRCVQREERIEKRRKRKRRKKSTEHHNSEDEEKSKQEAEWSSVREYLDVNSHMHGPVGHGVRQAKCRLEEKINEAIGKGEMEAAEQLSDQLSIREFGVRAANAFAAKQFAQDKQDKKKKRLKNARKKLHWGFETKQRWEMKGNM